MQTHMVKLNEHYFDAVESGEKPFEVRRDDRGYQKGDRILLCRHGEDGFQDTYGDVVSAYPDDDDVAKLDRVITYVLTGGQFGIEPGYVVLGLGPFKAREAKPDD